MTTTEILQQRIWALIIDPRAKLLLLALARFADAGGVVASYEAVATAVAQTHLGTRVSEVLRYVIALGYLRFEEVGNDTYGYRIVTPDDEGIEQVEPSREGGV